MVGIKFLLIWTWFDLSLDQVWTIHGQNRVSEQFLYTPDRPVLTLPDRLVHVTGLEVLL